MYKEKRAQQIYRNNCNYHKTQHPKSNQTCNLQAIDGFSPVSCPLSAKTFRAKTRLDKNFALGGPLHPWPQRPGLGPLPRKPPDTRPRGPCGHRKTKTIITSYYIFYLPHACHARKVANGRDEHVPRFTSFQFDNHKLDATVEAQNADCIQPQRCMCNCPQDANHFRVNHCSFGLLACSLTLLAEGPLRPQFLKATRMHQLSYEERSHSIFGLTGNGHRCSPCDCVCAGNLPPGRRA